MRLTAIFDSCHSGSALDLPYIYSTQGVLKEPNLAKEAGQGLLGIVSSYARGDLGGVASTALGLFKKATTGDATYKRNLRTKTSPADVIMWSGSKDSQTSYVDPKLPDEPPFIFLEPAIVEKEDCKSLLMLTGPATVDMEDCKPSLPNAGVPYRDMDGNILI